jgi:FLVCR family feline leukemia virus subgroup C receptor-related protein
MISYCLCTFANGFQWVTFSAIATKFAHHYNLESWKVNMFSLIYLILYPIVCIPQGHLVDNYSTRLGIIIAAVCTIAASAFKLLINKSIIWCYIGQFMAAVFQPALLNSPGKISANWFRDDIRTLICTLCCLSDTIGIFIGFLWNLMFINENEENSEEYKRQVFIYLLSEFILSFTFCVPSFFIIKDKPDIPPSPSQEQEKSDNENQINLIQSLKMLFKNKRFIYLFFSTFFVVGYYNILGTLINPLFELYSISGNNSSIIFFIASILGMISSIIISKIVDKTQKFKLSMILLCVFGTIFQILLTILLEIFNPESNEKNENSTTEFVIALILYSLVTMVDTPFYTIGMNYACEITYPVGESINGGMMMTSSHIAGIGGTFLCDYFISEYPEKKWITNLIMCIFFGIACVFVFLFDEKLDRHEIDKNMKSADI